MSTYFAIKGQKIQGLSPEPTNLTLGQVWYNTSAQSIRLNTIIGPNAWATGNNMNLGRKRAGGCGTQTSAVVFGGEGPSSNKIAATELYNGTWTSSGNMSMGRNSLGSCGTQTAALAFGGQGTNPSPPSITNVTEKFNGSAWTTNPSAMTYGRGYLKGAGTQTAAVAFGGENVGSGPTVFYGYTENFNGSSWTNGGNLNQPRYNIGGAGTLTSALCWGGTNNSPSNPPSFIAGVFTEQYNGSVWTSNSATFNPPGGRSDAGSAGASNSSVISFGGSPAGADTVANFNGSAWTTTTALNNSTNRGGMSGAGTQTAALGIGGKTSAVPGGATDTEIWFGSQSPGSITINAL